MKIEEVTLHTAEEVYQFLSPAVSRFSSGIASRRWLFRGLPDASYTLLPTALREGSWELMNRIAGRSAIPNCDSTSLQIYYEFNVLAKFYAEVDVQGLPVADDAPELRPFLHRPSAWAVSYLQKLVDNKDTWPPAPLRGLAALAQHHGLPTRLLDWSHDPFVACYFACKGYHKDSEYLVVWAVDSYAIERSGGAVEIVTAPAASNPNLHAQRGVFTVNPIVLTTEKAFGPVLSDPVDVLLQKVESIDSALMYKILIPRGESQRLLSLVNRLGYKPSTLFPGYGGAARTVLESTSEFKLDNWEARITMLVPEEKLEVARSVAALVDPYSEGHNAFVNSYFVNETDDRYYAMSTVAPIEAAPLIRQIAESISGSIFFFQQARSEELVDTNSSIELGHHYKPIELIQMVGFRREESDDLS